MIASADSSTTSSSISATHPVVNAAKTTPAPRIQMAICIRIANARRIPRPTTPDYGAVGAISSGVGETFPTRRNLFAAAAQRRFAPAWIETPARRELTVDREE